MIEFLDHSYHDGKSSPPIQTKVAGWVLEDSANHIVIEPWSIVGPEEFKDNHLTFCVIKGPTTRIRRAEVTR